MPITVALDRNADDPRPFVEAAGAKHPSLLDTQHRLAELYHMTNVPTILWIDEQGQIVRPHDSQFGTDTFTAFHHKRSDVYLEMIREWVRNGAGALAADETRKVLPKATPDSQLARAERALAWHLHQQGSSAAEAHFERACELAPKDWTIRRGSMPIRGQNPFGPEFFALAEEGGPEYALESITPTQSEDSEAAT